MNSRRFVLIKELTTAGEPAATQRPLWCVDAEDFAASTETDWRRSEGRRELRPLVVVEVVSDAGRLGANQPNARWQRPGGTKGGRHSFGDGEL